VRQFIVLSIALALSGSAAAQERQILARVVSVEGKTCTVEVLEGYLVPDDAVEVWSEGGKRAATVTMPGGLLNQGDRMPGVGLSGPLPPPGAILSQKGRFSSWAQAQAALAAHPPKALGRVVSVEGTTVTLELLLGSLGNNDELDVFTPRRHSVGKVKLPSDIGLVTRGDRVKGIALVGATVEAGALVADRGRFASLAGVSAALPGASAATAADKPADGLKESTAGCLFTPAELARSLGFTVAAGRGTEVASGWGTSYSCTWGEEKGRRSVTVRRMVLTTGDPATNWAQYKKTLAGRLEPIGGDADQGVWQVDQGDLTGVTLHYFRGNTATSVRVSGVDIQDPRAVAAMRQAVLTLRRL
jgi:hypothetical protein